MSDPHVIRVGPAGWSYTDWEGTVYPKHGSTFSLVTGEPQSLPATRPVPVYEVTVADGDVTVELS